MNKSELTQYLKGCMDLETQIYKTEQEVKALDEVVDNTLKLSDHKTGDNAPTLYSYSEPEPPVHYRDTEYKGFYGIAIFLLVGGIIELLTMDHPLMGCFTLCLCLFMALLAFSRQGDEIKTNKERDQKYQKELAKYREDYAKDKEEYERRLYEYNRKLDEDNKRIDLVNSIKKEASKEIVKILYDAKSAMWSAQSKLEILYDKNVIFPKYRNLVAVSTFYEYLSSSRCDSLEGPYGCYNLYETESRQNVIIIQMQKILKMLDDIKQNQYCLYQAISEANSSIRNVQSSLNGIENTLYKITLQNDYQSEVETFIAECSAQIARDIDRIHRLQIADYIFN